MSTAAIMSENKVEFRTAPFDPRFPNTNQTRNCWQNYVDYHRCQKLKGEDYEPCNYFKRVYMALCPLDWAHKAAREASRKEQATKFRNNVTFSFSDASLADDGPGMARKHFYTDKWDEQRAEGRFPGKI